MVQSDSFLRNLNPGSEIQFRLMVLEGGWVYLGAEGPWHLAHIHRTSDILPFQAFGRPAVFPVLDSSIPWWLHIAQAGFCRLQSVESELSNGLNNYPPFADKERGSQIRSEYMNVTWPTCNEEEVKVPTMWLSFSAISCLLPWIKGSDRCSLLVSKKRITEDKWLGWWHSNGLKPETRNTKSSPLKPWQQPFAPLHFPASFAGGCSHVTGSGQWNVHRSNRCHFLAEAVKSQGLEICDGPMFHTAWLEKGEDCLTHAGLSVSVNETQIESSHWDVRVWLLLQQNLVSNHWPWALQPFSLVCRILHFLV